MNLLCHVNKGKFPIFIHTLILLFWRQFLLVEEIWQIFVSNHTRTRNCDVYFQQITWHFVIQYAFKRVSNTSTWHLSLKYVTKLVILLFITSQRPCLVWRSPRDVFHFGVDFVLHFRCLAAGWTHTLHVEHSPAYSVQFECNSKDTDTSFSKLSLS